MQLVMFFLFLLSLTLVVMFDLPIPVLAALFSMQYHAHAFLAVLSFVAVHALVALFCVQSRVLAVLLSEPFPVVAAQFSAQSHSVVALLSVPFSFVLFSLLL